MQQENGLDKVAVEASTSVWASSEAHMQVSDDDRPSLVGVNICSTAIELLVLTGQQIRLPEKLLFCKAWRKPVQSDLRLSHCWYADCSYRSSCKRLIRS